MIMIYQSLHARKEFSALVKLAMKHTDDTEHLTEILQHYYDLACQAAIPKRRRNKRRYMKMADKNGKEVIVSVRLNGRQPKPIYINEDTVIILKLIRIRCDSLSRCDTLYLSVWVPRRRMTLEAIADILLASSPRAAIHAHVNSLYSPWMIRRLWKQWESTWQKRVERILNIFPKTINAFHRASQRHISQKSSQLFQAGRACSVIKAG